MLLFERGRTPDKVWINKAEDEAVQLAAEQLCADVERVCGVRPVLTHEDSPDVRVMVGVYGVGVDEPVPADLLDEQGKPRWEGFCQQTRENRLWLCGCDRRGAIYAIYRFCERMGVSPWHDMADVPVKRRERVELPDDFRRVDWPCVKWRGIFLNDEEELDAWARRHTPDDTIGPHTYARIFELLLRLGGNMIWPAMHVNAFNMNPENGRLAQRMGVVTGTSHCDMLHRSNQNEWQPWVESKGYTGLKYDFSIPGTNRERLVEYWRESLEQNRDYEAIYTIGMRGIHDSGLVAERMDAADGLAGQRKLMEEIFRVQRGLIREVVGENAPQTFVPYKEVLPIYDSGLNVPEDVTLVWADDNHGHVRRYPSEAERRRSGGNGLYYHSSYWAPPGMSWLFVCSVPLAHMGNELHKCWEQGVRTLWVDNVGALKAIEQDAEYFLRYAWDAGREDALVMDTKAWTAAWVNSNFSGNHGAEAADIYVAFAQLANLCKPEHMRSHVFSQTAYGDEAAARLWKLHALSKRLDAVWKALPANEQDAFFQLMGMKVKATFLIAASYYFADRSLDAYKLGAMRSAEMNLRRSRDMDDLKRMLLYYYNERMSGGKWSGVLTPEAFPPPPLELYPACAPALRIEPGKLLLRLPDGSVDGALALAKGEETWFELFNSGSGSIRYSLDADDGIALATDEGSVPFSAAHRIESEARVFVSTSADFTQGNIRCESPVGSYTIPVRRAAQEPWIHIPAAEARDAADWRCVKLIGRGQGDALEAAASTSEQHPARLRFDFTLAEPCAPEVEIIRFLTLNSVGGIRLRVTLDGGWSQAIASETTDEWRGDWVNAAMHNGEKLYARLPMQPAGAHTLTVEAMDPYITLSAVNLYLAPRQESQLGPGVSGARVPIPAFDTRAEAALFGLRMDEVPLPDTIYADEDFWRQNMVYARVKHVPQKHYGAPLCVMDADGNKDLLRALPAALPAEVDGSVRIDAMCALRQDDSAWTTPGSTGRSWTHRQSESYARTGVAMCLPADELDVGAEGPKLHYRFACGEKGEWRMWLLMKYDDLQKFKCNFYLDGQPLEQHASVCRSHFHTYRTIYMWVWKELAVFEMGQGTHELMLEAQTTGMAIDRIFLTRGKALPPMDSQWQR